MKNIKTNKNMVGNSGELEFQLLSKSNPIKFELLHDFSHITLKKVIYRSKLKGNIKYNEWLKGLSNIFLKFTYEDKYGSIKEITNNLLEYISPITPKVPIPINIHVPIPFENSKNLSYFKPPYNTLYLSIDHIDPNYEEKYEVGVFYNKTPGVKKLT